jgi:WD40 repeat protein
VTAVLRFDAWKEGKIRPTTFKLALLPTFVRPVREAVSPLHLATLKHAQDEGVVFVRYTADGKHLIASGYDSGIVEVYDSATRKRLHRLETGKGGRHRADYARFSGDGRTLFLTEENKRKTDTIIRDGKKITRFVHFGGVRHWDIITGKEGVPFASEKDAGALTCTVSPDGQWLVVGEIGPQDESTRGMLPYQSYLWNTQTRTKRPLGAFLLNAAFLPDSSAFLFVQPDPATGEATLFRVEVATGKVTAKRACPLKGGDLHVSQEAIAPDGKIALVGVGRKRGAKMTANLVDTRTLKDVHVIEMEKDIDGTHICGGEFLASGTAVVVKSRLTDYLVIDRTTRRETGRLVLPKREQQATAVSPDGRWWAMVWLPPVDEDLSQARGVELKDWPQPRISVFDLRDLKAKPVTLMAPEGFIGNLAFSPNGKQLALGGWGEVHLFDWSK